MSRGRGKAKVTARRATSITYVSRMPNQFSMLQTHVVSLHRVFLGKILGRPKASKHVETQIRARCTEGAGILKIAKELGVGTSVVQRVVKQMAA